MYPGCDGRAMGQAETKDIPRFDFGETPRPIMCRFAAVRDVGGLPTSADRLTTKKQAYDLTSVINEVRGQVDTW